LNENSQILVSYSYVCERHYNVWVSTLGAKEPEHVK
jgi:hypothetical protein